MDFREREPPSLAESTQSTRSSSTQQVSELWEVVEEPRGKLGADRIMPERQEGYLLKKRKWPLRGWHKRYFVLEDGILQYATTRQDITKGKLHGSIDIRLSVMSINKKAQRIDLDTEDNIYHLKIKSQDLFQSWVTQLRAHRLAQHLDVRGSLPSTTQRKVPGAQLPAAGNASPLPGLGPREKVSSWLRDSDGLDRCSHGEPPTCTRHTHRHGYTLCHIVEAGRHQQSQEEEVSPPFLLQGPLSEGNVASASELIRSA